MYGYIYRTTNKINGKIYIGQCHGDFDPKYLGSGNLIQLAIRKYGKDSFSVDLLFEATDQDSMDSKEIETIKNHRECHGRDMLYNIANGGLGHSGPFTEEHLKNIGIANRNPEKLAIMSSILKGRTYSPETIKRMSLAKKGKKATEETKAKMREALANRPPPSEETKRKLADTWRKRKQAFELAKKDNPSITIHEFRTTNRRGEKNI